MACSRVDPQVKKEETPVHIDRYFNVHTASYQRYGRCIDVGTMVCALLQSDTCRERSQ